MCTVFVTYRHSGVSDNINLLFTPLLIFCLIWDSINTWWLIPHQHVHPDYTVFNSFKKKIVHVKKKCSWQLRASIPLIVKQRKAFISDGEISTSVLSPEKAINKKMWLLSAELQFVNQTMFAFNLLVRSMYEGCCTEYQWVDFKSSLWLISLMLTLSTVLSGWIKIKSENKEEVQYRC